MAVVRSMVFVLAALGAVGCISVGQVNTETPSASPAVVPTAAATIEPSPSLAPTIGPASLAPTSQATDPAMPTPPLTAAPATATPTAAPTATPTATPTAPATPRPSRIRTFEATGLGDGPPYTIDCNVEPEPVQVHLEWEVARATSVSISIDGPGVYQTYDGREGSADVPFACSERRHTYLLTTIGGDGAAATREITIRRARPRVEQFFTGTLSLSGPCTQVFQRNFFWEVDHAIGVHIWVEDQDYGTYTGRDGTVQLPYDCRNQPSVTYRIETTGPYGPHDSMEIEVSHVEPV